MEANVRPRRRLEDAPGAPRRLLTLGIALSAALSGSTALAAPPEGSLTIQRLLDHTLAHSPALAAQLSGVDVADGQLRQAWSAWKPNLAAQGEGRWNSVEAELDFGALFGGLGIDTSGAGELGEPVVIQPRWAAQGAISVRQLIFDPSAFFAPRMAAESKRAAEAQAEEARRDVLFGVVRMALGLESLDALEAAAARAVKVAEDRADDARIQLEAGIATPLDLTRAETSRTEAETNRQQVIAERARVQAELRALTGWDAALTLTKVPQLQTLVEGVDGFEQRPKIAAARAQVAAADENASSTELLWLPSIALGGQVAYSSYAGFVGQNVTATAFVGVEIPLYDGGLRYGKDDVAEAQLSRARSGLEAELRNARAEVEKAQASLREAQARLELAQAQLRTANQAVEQTEQLVEGGLATSLDQQTADGQRFGADRTLAERELALALAQLTLLRAQGGRLTTERR